VITEEKEEREGEMSKFKVGDRVICVKSSDFYISGEAAQKGFEGVVAEIRDATLRFKGYTGLFLASRFELIQDNKEKEVPDIEKKYKIATELSLQQMVQLRAFTGSLNNMTELFSECAEVLSSLQVDDVKLYPHVKDNYHIPFQSQCRDVVNKAQRKVVKVGEREYYEDELSAALANIKPIK
jgi:hypothetical protein